MSAEFEVQKALYTALSGLGFPVYDSAPQVVDGAGGMPYCEVGAVVFAEYDTRDSTGFDFVARIHTRSRSAAMREVKDMQGAIYSALHLASPAIAGYTTILLRRETSDVTRAADGSFHGVCEYRGLITK